MDEHNVHHFWGISPAVDFLSVAEALLPLEGPASEQPINILQAASYDSRHTITTLCRLHRHAQLSSRPIHVYVYEEEPEVLMRHILLLSILLDGTLLSKERMETLLEVHSNALLRDKTAEYLDKQGRLLEELMMRLATKTCQYSVPNAQAGSAGKQDTASKQQDQLQSLLTKFNLGPRIPANSANQASSSPSTTPDGTGAPPTASCCSTGSSYSGMQLLGQLLDISLLRFQDRDRLVEVLQGYRSTHAYDMVKAWDARQRKWYKDRFDARRNMIDWDYHMVMATAGTPGQSADKGSIVHFHHFRHWRMHGVAYELRDAWYSQPNRSLLSTAYGRTKEFKDRYGKDVGRSVCAHGYWGDLLNSPYHCWGTQCEDDAFYKFSNKQWARTAVDVAEYNVLGLLHELRTDSRYHAGQAPHRARVARGPTSLADLQEDSEQTSQAEAAAEKLRQEAAPRDAGGQADRRQQLGAITEQEEEEEEEEEAESEQHQAAEQPSVQLAELGGDAQPASDGVGSAVAGDAVVASGASSSTTNACSDSGFQASATFQGPRPGFVFKRGPQGVGYYPDMGKRQGVDKTAAPVHPAADIPSAQSPATDIPSAQSPAADIPSAQSPAAASASTSSQDGAGCSDGVATGQEADASKVVQGSVRPEAGDKLAQLQAEAEALRAAEEALDLAAASRLGGGRVKVIPVLGSGGTSPGAGTGGGGDGQAVADLVKLLTGKSKYTGLFHVLSVGHRHVHLLSPDYKLAQVAAPGAVLLVEGARHLLQLKADQAEVFDTKVGQMASHGGWAPAAAALSDKLRRAPQGSSAGMTLTPAHLLFTNQTV